MRVGLGRHVLAEVGVGADAEQVYQYLLGTPRSSAAEITAGCELSASRVRAALSELERNAMVSRQGSTASPRYQPAPPDIMVEALISAREDALRRTRLDALQLASLQRFTPEHVGDLVELLTSRQASALRWHQLQGSARRSFDVFVRPPFIQPRVDDFEDLQEMLLGRGVVIRVIYDEAALRHPGVLEHVARVTALGEQARVVSELPTKLVVVDRTRAMMPFTLPDPAAPGDTGLVVHQSPLLDALIALFDLYWERGTELRLGDDERGDGTKEPANEDTVLTLMAAGYKDEAIAGQLGVSTTTVRRRISALQSRLKVTTRFQAGLALGRSGWRDADAEATPGRPRTNGKQPPH